MMPLESCMLAYTGACLLEEWGVFIIRVIGVPALLILGT